MSFITDARRWSRNLSDKVNLLSHKIAQYTTDQSTEEGEDIIIRTEGRLAEDVIKYCDDDLQFSKLLELLPCYPPEEPDGDKLKLLLTGDEFGPTIPDRSGFGHDFINRGIARIATGIDYGNGGSYELQFDGRSTSPYLPYHSDFRLDNLSIGFSILFRFMPYRIGLTGGDTMPIFSYRYDADHLISFNVLPDGRLLYHLEYQNIQYDLVTPIGSIIANYVPRYEVVATFDHATTTPKLYVNNINYTDTDASAQWAIPPDNNLKLGHAATPAAPPAGQEYPEIADSKLYCGSLQSFKFWREKVLTPAEISNHYTNKLTIANIAFGQVAYPGTAFATA